MRVVTLQDVQKMYPQGDFEIQNPQTGMVFRGPIKEIVLKDGVVVVRLRRVAKSPANGVIGADDESDRWTEDPTRQSFVLGRANTTVRLLAEYNIANKVATGYVGSRPFQIRFATCQRLD